MKEFPRRFLSLRDKNGSHNRSKSAPPGNKQRGDTFRALFRNDQSKHSISKEEPEEKGPDLKIEDVQHRLDELGLRNISVEHIKDVMTSKYAEGDPEKTAEFIDIEHKASAGTIAPYNPQIHMLGAENRGNVTCYLDSLLFSMFAKMDAFECILKNDFPDNDSKHKLVNLLRIWVNMLRTGKLIRTDLTRLIQNALAECGWADARELEQQDTSEAFAFLTETLQLPLLSLQVDLFHHGKGDKDDHKVVYERLLNLAVPPDPEGKGIKLEDCLEEYFNARVDVLRDSEEAKKSATEDRFLDGRLSLVNRDTSRLVEEEGHASPVVTASPISISAPSSPLNTKGENSTASITMQRMDPEPPRSASSEAFAKGATGGEALLDRRPSTRHRSTSVIQNILIDESGRPASTDDTALLRRAKRKGSTVVKAVTIPAWQFFRLIPWHAVSSNEPKNDVEVAMNFDQRPVVGICLKRYLMDESGKPQRHNTYIDIPDTLRLPHFMLADGATDGEQDAQVLATDYKLVLQSVICHRGDNVQSGHYISFARVAPMLLTDNRRHDLDPPPDYEEAQWVRFDDLEVDGRVHYVDDIKQALKDEMPYLLFYQIVPMVDAPSTVGTDPEPPSYDDYKTSLEHPVTPVAAQHAAMISRRNDDATPTPGHLQSPPSKPPSIRFSTDFDRPRKSSDETGPNSYTESAQGESRRPSMNLTDSAVGTPALTPDGNHSPFMGPSDESTASRLSRAAARFKGKQSRPGSQSGENRVSSAMSRMAGLMRPSRDTLAEPTALNLSTPGPASSNGRNSLDNSRQSLESPLEMEKPMFPSGNSYQKKNGKSKDKDKDKDKEKDKEKEKEKEKEKSHKTKSGDQPERECLVM